MKRTFLLAIFTLIIAASIGTTAFADSNTRQAYDSNSAPTISLYNHGMGY